MIEKVILMRLVSFFSKTNYFMNFSVGKSTKTTVEYNIRSAQSFLLCPVWSSTEQNVQNGILKNCIQFLLYPQNQMQCMTSS